MREEIRKVLKMVRDKKISVEEGERLIEALDNSASAGETMELKSLKLYVSDEKNGKSEKVDIRIPVTLLEVGLKLGMIYGPDDIKEGMKDIDSRAIVETVKKGAKGKIVDIKSSSTKVEVFVE